MKMIQINWIRFTTILAGRIIKEVIRPLNSEERANVLIIDDSMYERNRFQKVKLLTKLYDHAKLAYKFEFRMLTLGWSDGNTFLLINSVLLSSENKKNRINEAKSIDKRTVGYKRRGRSKYLLSVTVDVVKDESVIPAKIVYVRNRNKRNEYLCLILTDVTLSKEEIIRIYGKRWDIKIFFKVCKSYLNLIKECHSMSYDAMTAHTTVVFTRYMMLFWKIVDPMITVLLVNSLYIFPMKCLTSHGYRHFKCSGQYFLILLSCQTRKSMNWWIHL